MSEGRKGLDNRGVTLIELVVVMAMIGILTGISFSAFQYIKFGDTKKCAAKIEDELDRLLVETMSKKEKRYLYLFKTANGYYVVLNEDRERENLTEKEAVKIAGNSIVIEKDGKELREDNMIKIGYQKENGAFSQEAYCNQIEIKGAGIYKIHLVKDTGFHYLEQ